MAATLTPAGEFRHEIGLQNPSGTPVPDGDGGFTWPYVDLSPAHAPAKITQASARDLDRVTVGTSLATATHLIAMPFHAGVTTQTRVTWTDPVGRAHLANVSAVQNPEERCIQLVLVCTEVVP